MFNRIIPASWLQVRDIAERQLEGAFHRELQQWGADAIYIAITQDETAANCDSGYTDGFTTPLFGDHTEFLADRFRGRGPGMWAATDKPINADTVRRFMEIVAHEMGHILEFSFRKDRFANQDYEKPPELIKDGSAEMDIAERIVSKDHEATCSPRKLAKILSYLTYCIDHGQEFCRAAVHAVERLRQFGWLELDGNRIHAWSDYTQGEYRGARAALAEEIEHFRNRSLSELFSTQPPVAFLDYWTAQAEDWKKRHRELVATYIVGLDDDGNWKPFVEADTEKVQAIIERRAKRAESLAC